MPLFPLPVAAGLLLAAAFPRVNQAWLGWAAWIPLIIFTARARSRRAAFMGGWLTGSVEFFILLRWMPGVMASYGGMPSFLSWSAYALLVAILACYPAIVCAYIRHLIFHRGERCLLFFPFVWIVMELAFSVSPIGGFPWLLAGYIQTRFLPVIQISDITGIYGVSFLLLCVNTSIAWFIHKQASGELPIEKKRKARGTRHPKHAKRTGKIVDAAPSRSFTRIFHRVSTTATQSGMSTALRLFGRIGILFNMTSSHSLRAPFSHARLRRLATKPYGISGFTLRSIGGKHETFAPLLAAVCLLACTLIYGYIAVNRWGKSEAPFRAALFQGNLAVDDPHDALLEKFQRGYMRMADSLAPDSVDIIVLPESSAPKLFQSDEDYRRTMENLAERYSMGLVLSNINVGEWRNGEGKYYNSAFFLSKDGALTGVYDKIHLVPFGEYVPYKKLLFFAETVSKEMGGFSAGNELRVMPLGGRLVNAVICFEAVFPDLVRRFVDRGSQLIVNLTNDGWYGISAAPYHHLEIARMRAVENRRYFLRAANTGISAVIEPTGRIAASTELAEEAICLGQFGFIEEKTFYSRHGNIFGRLCVIISAAAGIWATVGGIRN